MEQAIEKDILDKYDGVVEATLAGLFSQIRKSPNFLLRNFDVKNKKHLFILHCAFIVQNQFDKDLYFDARFIQKAKIKQYANNYHEKVRFVKSSNDLYDVYVIDVDNFANKIEAVAKDFIGESASIADIYSAFYEREK